MNRRSLSLFGTASALFFFAPPVDACVKWVAPITYCEAMFPVPQVCPVDWLDTATQLELRTFYQRIYFDDPIDACLSWGKYGYPAFDQSIVAADPIPGIDDQFYCYFDDNGNLEFDDAVFTLISTDVIEREACCERVPNGPHQSLPSSATTITDGGLFHRDLKKAVRAGNGVPAPAVPLYPLPIPAYIPPLFSYYYFTSDLHSGGPYAALASLECNPGTHPLQCYNLLTTYTNDWRPQPQVDHIIPRKDIKDCDCGDNSSANTLLVSAWLNNTMQNFCEDDGTPGGQAKSALIQQFTLP